MTLLIIYIASVVLSYFLFRWLLKKSDDILQPYGFYALIVFIPFGNIFAALLTILIEWAYSKPKINWKWFWGIKE